MSRPSNDWKRECELIITNIKEEHFIKQQDGWDVARNDLEDRLQSLQAEKAEAVAITDDQRAQASEGNSREKSGDQNNIVIGSANATILTQLRSQLHISTLHSTSLESTLATTTSALESLQTRYNHHEVLLKQATEELEELKGICERLREENGVWEGMVRERTVAGTMAFGLGLVEEEKEGEEESGEGGGSGSGEEVDVEREKRRARRRMKGKSLMDEMKGLDISENGFEEKDKAVEEIDPLTQEITSTCYSMPLWSGHITEKRDVPALKAEIKHLKDDNKRH